MSEGARGEGGKRSAVRELSGMTHKSISVVGFCFCFF